MRAATYCRTKERGTDDLAQQRKSIEAYARAKGIEIVKHFASTSCDGTEPFAQRPAVEKMLADADRGLFDAIVIVSIDRLSHSIDDAFRAIHLIVSKGITLLLVEELIEGPPPRYAEERHPEFRNALEETAWANYWDAADPTTVDRLLKLVAASRSMLPERLQSYLAEEQELLEQLRESGSTLAEWLDEVYPAVEGRSPSGGETVGKEQG